MLTASQEKGTYINGILKGVEVLYCNIAMEEGYGAFNTKLTFHGAKKKELLLPPLPLSR